MKVRIERANRFYRWLHEYSHGVVAIRREYILVDSTARSLSPTVAPTPCEYFRDAQYYPDVMVCCDLLPPEADDHYKTAPKLIVEVLCPGTAANDDGEKRVNYQTLDSLEEYLLLDPETLDAVLYRRSRMFWTRIALSRGDEIELQSVRFRWDLASFFGAE